MGGDGACTAEMPKLAGDAIGEEQVFCAEAGGVEGEAKVGMDEFRAKFKAKFNEDVKLYAPYVYDATKVLVAAMVKANSTDPAKYLPVLAATADYKGVTGPISFDEKGDIKNGALTLYTYKGGERTQLAVIR
jgi:branched-chain amino acid transport system substrate-binding protein